MADIEYIVGRPFDVNGHDVWPGETLADEDVDNIPALDSWVSAGYIYRVTPAKGYDSLPPHIYSIVNTRAEVESILAGDPGITSAVDSAQEAGAAAETTQLAEKQARTDEAHAEHRRRQGKLTAADRANAVVAARSTKGK
jgi:hypothetical protein